MQHIQTLHTDFPFVFCRRFVSLLTATKSVEESTNPGNANHDTSYDAYIGCWVMWAIEKWQASSGYLNLRKEVLSHLLQELGCYPSHRVPMCDSSLLSKGLFADASNLRVISLLEVLSIGRSEFEAMTALLLRPPSQSSQVVIASLSGSS